MKLGNVLRKERAPRRPVTIVRNRPLVRAALALACLGIGALSLTPLRPPAAAPASAPAGEFSAARATEVVRELARLPHPVGSSEHERVRGRLVARLAGLGLEPREQESLVAAAIEPGRARVAPVANVMARIPGDGEGALLLAAHYDTAPASPGAADDGAGVAALLETARALLAGPPPPRDVILLFTDGEELRLLGAEAFVGEHPWADGVRAALNLEARGAGGPAILFETGPGSTGLVRRFAELSPAPVAASLSADVYRRLPNDTDFSVFKRAGLPGLNFAFIDDFEAYHSSLDTAERLDPASLQHQGAQLLALTRGITDADLEVPADADPGNWFVLPGAGLVVHPQGWMLPLAVLLLVATLALTGVAAVRGRIGVGRMLAALGIVPLALVAAVALTFAAGAAWQGLAGVRSSMLPPGTHWDVLAWAAFGLAGASGTLFAFSARVGVRALAAGGLAWWAGLAVAASLALPASSYLLVWPGVFALAALAALLRRRDDGPAAPLPAALALLAAAAALLLWAPSLYLIGLALDLGAGLPIAGAAGLLTALLFPAVAAVGLGARRWPLPVAAVAVGVAVLVALVAVAGYSTDRPRPDSLFYALDGETGEAVWASYDPAPDPWTAPRLEGAERRPLDAFYDSDRPVSVAPAEPFPLAAPEVSLAAADDREGRTRRVLRVRSPRGAPRLDLRLRAPGGVEVVSAGGREAIGGGPPVPWSERATVELYALPTEGLEVEVVTESSAPLEVLAVDRTYELPPEAGLPDRPPDLRPTRARLTDVTLVRSAFSFPAGSGAGEERGPSPAP